MHKAPKLLLASAVILGAALFPPSHLSAARAAEGSSGPSPQATVQPVAARSPDIPFPEFETASEQQLLTLVNQSRTQAGLAALTLDSGLSQAARTHAEAMLEAHQLSHQFQGEPSVVDRVIAATSRQLDEAGENVAVDSDAVEGHRHLMLSPPHRANLLNASYNVVGLGVIRSGNQIYIVEDFGRALPSYSVVQAKSLVATAVNKMRKQSQRPVLPRRDLAIADNAACSMAHADKLATDDVQKLVQHYTVLSFTTVHPETLPAESLRAISSPNLRSYSVGACYARTTSYPMGTYWVVLSLE